MPTQCSDDLDSTEYSSSSAELDTVDEELLNSLNSLLVSVLLPKLHHILDATPNLLIALYERLFRTQILEVDRSRSSNTSLASRIKNVKLLIGTIAHEVLVGANTEVELGEIDPRKVCEKDVEHVRELLWVLVRIGEAMEKCAKDRGSSLGYSIAPARHTVTSGPRRWVPESRIHKKSHHSDLAGHFKNGGPPPLKKMKSNLECDLSDVDTGLLSYSSINFSNSDGLAVEDSHSSASQIFSTPGKPGSLSVSYFLATPKTRSDFRKSFALATASTSSIQTPEAAPYESPLAKATSLRRNLLAGLTSVPKQRQQTLAEDSSSVSTNYLDKMSAKVIEISKRMQKLREFPESSSSSGEVPNSEIKDNFGESFGEAPDFQRERYRDRKVGIWLQGQSISPFDKGIPKQAGNTLEGKSEEEERRSDAAASPSPIRIERDHLILQPAETPAFMPSSNLRYDSGISMLSPESAFSLSPVEARRKPFAGQKTVRKPWMMSKTIDKSPMVNRGVREISPKIDEHFSKTETKQDEPTNTQPIAFSISPASEIGGCAQNDGNYSETYPILEKQLLVHSTPPSLPLFSPVSEFTMDFDFDIKTEELTRHPLAPVTRTPIPYYKLEAEKGVTKQLETTGVQTVECENEYQQQSEQEEQTEEQTESKVTHTTLIQHLQGQEERKHKQITAHDSQQGMKQQEHSSSDKALASAATNDPHPEEFQQEKLIEATEDENSSKQASTTKQSKRNSAAFEDDHSAAMDLTNPLQTPLQESRLSTTPTLPTPNSNPISTTYLPTTPTPFNSYSNDVPTPRLSLTRKPLAPINLLTAAQLFSRTVPSAQTKLLGELEEETSETHDLSPIELPAPEECKPQGHQRNLSLSKQCPCVFGGECDIESTSSVTWSSYTSEHEGVGQEGQEGRVVVEVEPEERGSDVSERSGQRPANGIFEADTFWGWDTDSIKLENEHYQQMEDTIQDDSVRTSHQFEQETIEDIPVYPPRLPSRSPRVLRPQTSFCNPELTHPIPTPVPQQIVLSQLLVLWQAENPKFAEDVINSSAMSTVTWGNDSFSVKNLRAQREEALKGLSHLEMPIEERDSKSDENIHPLHPTERWQIEREAEYSVATATAETNISNGKKPLQPPSSAPTSKLGGRKYVISSSRTRRLTSTAALTKRSSLPLPQNEAASLIVDGSEQKCSIQSELQKKMVHSSSPLSLKTFILSGQNNKIISPKPAWLSPMSQTATPVKLEMDKENLFLPTLPTFDVDNIHLCGSPRTESEGRGKEKERKDEGGDISVNTGFMGDLEEQELQEKQEDEELEVEELQWLELLARRERRKRKELLRKAKEKTVNQYEHA